jgi:DNA-directed RNA polymerase specialized sigma24 family protein
MADSDAKSLEQKLDMLIRLNAYMATKDMKVADAAPILNELGMSASEIALILGSTPNAVNVRISEARAEKKKGKVKNNEQGS